MLEDLLQAANRIAATLGGAPVGSSQMVWDQVRPWLTRFTTEAVSRWLPVLVEDMPCNVPVIVPNRKPVKCTHSAIGSCKSCGNSTCLAHSFVDATGTAVCFLCIGQVIELNKIQRAEERGGRRARAERQRHHRAPGPGADHQHHQHHQHDERRGPSEDERRPTVQQIRLAYELLQIPRGSSFEEARRRVFELSRVWHPDRFRDAAQKLEAENKMKAFSAALAVIKDAIDQGREAA